MQSLVLGSLYFYAYSGGTADTSTTIDGIGFTIALSTRWQALTESDCSYLLHGLLLGRWQYVTSRSPSLLWFIILTWCIRWHSLSYLWAAMDWSPTTIWSPNVSWFKACNPGVGAVCIEFMLTQRWNCGYFKLSRNYILCKTDKFLGCTRWWNRACN